MVTIGINSPLCSAITLNLLSGGGDSYLWLGRNGFTSTLQNPTIPNVTMATAGSYTVKVTNSSGCYTISTPTLVVINPKYKFNETAAICAGDFYIWHGQNITNAGTYTDPHLSKFGCDSIYTLQLTIIQTKQVKIVAFLEGLYSGLGVMRQAQGISGAAFGSGIADKLTIELHNASSPYSIAYTYSNKDLDVNGVLTINNMECTISGLYYVVIKHRNSIETWSSVPIDFSRSIISYDFTTAASKAYGNNMKLSGGNVYSIYAGDATQDGVVDGSDMAVIDNGSRPPIIIGYYPEDINGDGIVDASDMAIIDNNSRTVVVTIRP